MSHLFSMLNLFNAALTSQGWDAVDPNDGSNEFIVLSRKWPIIIEAELEDGLYSFTKKQAQLLTRADGSFGYDDAFMVPADALFVRRVWTEDANGTRDTSIDWVQDATHVHCCSPEGVFIEYCESADPSLWSANFAAGVTARLEAVVLRALKEESSEAERMDQKAEFYFQRARTNSSKSRSAKEPFRSSRLASARFRRG